MFCFYFFSVILGPEWHCHISFYFIKITYLNRVVEALTVVAGMQVPDLAFGC